MTELKNIHIFIKKYDLYNMYTLERKKHMYSYQYLFIKHNYKSSLIPIQQYFIKLQKI